MTFPVIRPDAVDRMPWPVRRRLLEILDEECTAAALRNAAILAARGRPVRAADVPSDPPDVLAARRVELGETLLGSVRAGRRGDLDPRTLSMVRRYERARKRHQRDARRVLAVAS